MKAERIYTGRGDKGSAMKGDKTIKVWSFYINKTIKLAHWDTHQLSNSAELHVSLEFVLISEECPNCLISAGRDHNKHFDSYAEWCAKIYSMATSVPPELRQ